MPPTLEIPFFSWSPACWLRVEGPDAFSFLQGQFSNDLRPLAAGHGAEAQGRVPAVYGLWLDRKGRILGDGFVLRAGAEQFFICSYETEGAALHAQLESFIIADEVEVFDETAAVLGLTLLTAELPSSGFGAGGFVFAGRRGPPAWEYVGPAQARAHWLASLDPQAERSAAEMEQRRIFAKVPAVPRDLGSADLPQEGGADFECAAVSYSKGCYIGQEVMSRLHAMGRVRRQLVLARGPAAPPEVLPAALYLGEKRVGELRSAVAVAEGGFSGLALVSTAGLQAAPVRLSAQPGGPSEIAIELPAAAPSA